MSFSQKTWANGSTGGTPITASDLNRIEQGVADASTAIAALPTSYASLPNTVLGWALAGSYAITSATRDSNGAITTASVEWPDGTPGTFTTDTASTTFPGAIDAYHVTYGSPAVHTYTQPAVTRDASSGAVTAQPMMTVS